MATPAPVASTMPSFTGRPAAAADRGTAPVGRAATSRTARQSGLELLVGLSGTPTRLHRSFNGRCKTTDVLALLVRHYTSGTQPRCHLVNGVELPPLEVVP